MERFSPDLTECYRILGLSSQATLEEIKSAYRKLAKQYHPDRNLGDRQAADQFIRINEAYDALLATEGTDRQLDEDAPAPARSVRPTIRVKRSSASTDQPPAQTPLTPEQARIKQRSLELISMLLEQGQWQQAARHAEALTTHFPQDRELGRVRAKAYHGWARELLDRRYYDAARPYLQKAMKADPENRSLWEEIERDYLRIERGLRL